MLDNITIRDSGRIMSIRHIQTVEDVISELGGPKAVQELCRLESSSAVPTWKLRGAFPPRTYAVMQSALATRGATAPDDLWKMVAAEDAAS
jgi:hypothetical protein